MSCLRIYQDNYIDATIVSNRFIDEYMADANDAQLKIYLFILRAVNGSDVSAFLKLPTPSTTRKRMSCALSNTGRNGVFSLEYDSDRNLSGIHLLALEAREAAEAPKAPVVSLVSRQDDKAEPQPSVQKPVQAEAVKTPAPVPSAKNAPASEEDKPAAAASSAFVKPAYSLDELKAFQEKDSTAQLLFIAEQYLGRTLSPADMKSILFFSDGLHFSDDLIDYLLQYCVERGKKDFRYIEKVAISWAEAHVSTPVEAEGHASRYDKCVYTIMNALGKTNAPTRREAEYIRRWRRNIPSKQILL